MVRRKKIAISIIFSLCEREAAQQNFQDFFFSHFPLFESHMNRLKSAIEKVRVGEQLRGRVLTQCVQVQLNDQVLAQCVQGMWYSSMTECLHSVCTRNGMQLRGRMLTVFARPWNPFQANT